MHQTKPTSKPNPKPKPKSEPKPKPKPNSIPDPTSDPNPTSAVMERIMTALKRVDVDVNQGILTMINLLTEREIINLFNQSANDFFTTAIDITIQMKIENKFNFSGYKNIFESTLKVNATLPIDKFTIIILEYAPDIYDANEQYFLNMDIPDGEIKTENAFSIIRSSEFKEVWKILSLANKAIIKEKITSLTTYAHAYFYKIIFAI